MMNALRNLLALFALLCVACGSAEPAETIGEPAPEPAPLTREERTAIAFEHAITTWADAVGWVPAVENVRYEEPRDDKDRVTAAMNVETSTMIIIPKRLGDNQERWNLAVMHEFGHAYGLGHNPHPLAVMNALPQTKACVHETDVVALSAIGIEARSNCWR